MHRFLASEHASVCLHVPLHWAGLHRSPVFIHMYSMLLRESEPCSARMDADLDLPRGFAALQYSDEYMWVGLLLFSRFRRSSRLFLESLGPRLSTKSRLATSGSLIYLKAAIFATLHKKNRRSNSSGVPFHALRVCSKAWLRCLPKFGWLSIC